LVIVFLRLKGQELSLLLAGEKIVARQKRDAFDLSTNFQLDNKTNYTICLQFFL